MCTVQRTHVQKRGEDASIPHDDLTACLRMCGMPLKAIHALHNGGQQSISAAAADDSTFPGTPLFKRAPSMGSTNAGGL